MSSVRLPSIPRKTIVYILLLLTLVILFVLQEIVTTEQNTVSLPEITAPVDQIRIEDAESRVVLNLQEEPAEGDEPQWTLGDEAYPTEDAVIEQILSAVRELGTLRIVSSRGHDGEYGLDEQNRRTLRLFTGDLEPLAFQFGAAAAAGNGVYGRVNGSREIVILPAALETLIATDPFRYRQKTMVTIPEETILEARITSPLVEEIRVQRRIEEDDAGQEAAAPAGDAPTPTDAPPTMWSAGAREIPPAQLDAFIRELGAVTAVGFPEDTESIAAAEPFARIAVETVTGETVTIDLWPPEGEEGERRVLAESSASPYHFYLPEWRARRLLPGLEQYLAPPQ